MCPFKNKKINRKKCLLKAGGIDFCFIREKAILYLDIETHFAGIYFMSIWYWISRFFFLVNCKRDSFFFTKLLSTQRWTKVSPGHKKVSWRRNFWKNKDESSFKILRLEKTSLRDGWIVTNRQSQVAYRHIQPFSVNNSPSAKSFTCEHKTQTAVWLCINLLVKEGKETVSTLRQQTIHHLDKWLRSINSSITQNIT